MAGKSRSSVSTLSVFLVVAAIGLVNLCHRCSAQPRLSERLIIEKNALLKVRFGRTVDLDPVENLRLRVMDGDSCLVNILQNDPLSQQPGRLQTTTNTATTFPCNFKKGDVRYTHFGTRHPPEDKIRLQLRYDSNTETIIVPFTIEVDVLFTQLEIVTKNMPLTVEKVRGLSNPIRRRQLQLTYDRSAESCKVTVLHQGSGLPRYGQVVDDGGGLVMRDCDDFLQGDVQYRHTGGPSPSRDYIPMMVELVNKESGEMKREYFQMMVRIREAEENIPPAVSYTSLLVMEVDQFVMTAITPEILSAEDTETIANKLIFNITQPLGLGEGEIVSTDDQTQAIKSFYQKDVQDLKIAYKPPATDSETRRVFSVGMQVVDEDGGNSDPFMLMIVLKPMNTLAPVVTRNTGVQLFEGQSRLLYSPRSLEISDEDNLEDVRLTVIDGLHHGKLLIMGHESKFFTPADVDAGIVVYQHDGSDTYSDNIIFGMTDGEHNVEFLFPVTIYPIDDEPPILNVNTGLMINKNELVEITPDVLSATDIDSDVSNLHFIVDAPFSTEGEIVKRQFERPDDTTGWRELGGIWEKSVRKWKQSDIMEGKIFYRHIGPHRSTFVMDRINFHLLDTADPPNKSGMHALTVKVMPVDDQPPYLYPETPLKMQVEEFQLSPFTRHVLRYTDLDSNDRELKYTITKQPYDTDDRSPLEAGKIVWTDNPDEVMNMFTQAQVNHHKIAYRPPSTESGVAPRMLEFRYTVQDTNGNVLPDQVFTIMLQPVNNQPPVVTNRGVDVYENGVSVITTENLDVQDRDTDESHISFTVTALPKHGLLQYGNRNMRVGQIFRKTDIASGRIMYINRGVEMDTDDFSVDVSDGVHHVPVTFRMTIQSVDDEKPIIEMPPGELGLHITVPEGQATPITSQVLKATDPDTNDLMLTFIIEVLPRKGAILVSGRPSRHFTQQDVIQGKVEYLHTGGEIGRRPQTDSFNLTLSDLSDDFIVGGNRVQHIGVEVTIIPVDNHPPNVTVSNQIFKVAEGGKSTINDNHISASDVDTDTNAIRCSVIVPPTQGYLENISPAPGSEKPRAGMPITSFSMLDLERNLINYVQSIHKGVEPIEDRFTFSCTDGINISPNRFFSIMIEPSNDEIPEIHAREFIVMEGMHLIIDTPILTAIDKDIPVDKLTFFITVPPKHGTIVEQRPSEIIPIHNFTMALIAAGSSIVYEHDDSETKKDSFVLVLTDGEHEVTKEIPIMVIPVDDETPRLTNNNGLEIDVGDIRAITNEDLMATDLDSVDFNITYVVRKPPMYGFLQRVLGYHVQNITKGMNFSQGEIDSGWIQYVHTGRGGVRDLIKFDVTDRINPLIDRYFYITIGGLDSIYPDVLNKGVELPEGGSVILTTNSITATDTNSADENLEYTVTRAPSRGHLENIDFPRRHIVKFTQLQLASNKIRYVHTSDDEMKMDNFEFEVTDGYNPVFRTFRISLTDVDNKKPVLMFETLRVKEGGVKLITPFELSVDDTDTSSSNIILTVTESPQHGQILYNKSRPTTSFTMEDLNENLITYKHDGSETTQDSFTISVTDGTHPDFYVVPDTTRRTHREQIIPIEIVPVDNAVPELIVNSGSASLSRLDSGDYYGLLLTSKVLQAIDKDSPVRNLVYTILSPPRHGYLVNKAYGNRSITMWTQGDIDDMQIEYRLSAASNEGQRSTQDSFKFKVTDKGGNVLDQQHFQLNWAWVSLETDAFSIKETDRRLQVKLKRRGYLAETVFVSITAHDSSARAGLDFRKRYARQVQFNPGDTEKYWNLRLIDDDVFENKETFTLELHDPVMAVIEEPRRARVTIVDDEDESLVSFPSAVYEVEEDIGEALIPIRREGDLSDELMLICETSQGTAKGTIPGTITSGSDFITRPPDHNSVIRFEKGVKEKFCAVRIIDDTLYEGRETFHVILSMVHGGMITQHNVSQVTILPHSEDEPVVFFDAKEYSVDESEKFVDVKLRRIGTDLRNATSVTVRSKKAQPHPAQAGMDYHAINKFVEFPAGGATQRVRVRIIDDLGRPKLEGLERFQLVLLMPTGGRTGQPSKATITINDTYSDMPVMQFKEASYTVYENAGSVNATIVRSGDLSQSSSVRCYTRQASALVMMDYDERPNTDASLVKFLPGEREKACTVLLMNDTAHERAEYFRLVLGHPSGTPPGGARIGPRNQTRINIKDSGDKPLIEFEGSRYTVKEPVLPGDVSVVRIPVVRRGDLSKLSVVRVHTRDGLAESGVDYNGFSTELRFTPGKSRHVVELEVLHDGEKETRESFTIHLRPDRFMVADIGNNKATIYIEEKGKMADVTFPSQPMVVSLQDYNNIDGASRQPTPGYPVICITPCNPKYPDYAKTGVLCKKEGINDTLTRYRWRVAAPTGQDGVTSPMRDVESQTFFTDAKTITLDSIYFGAGSRVQCHARAVTMEGDPGIELHSRIKTIGSDSSVCAPRVMGSVGAEPFTAKMRYTGPDDEDHPNMIRLSVTIPHRDGMLPVISTKRLSNFELILSPDGLRVGQHRCSNLLDVSEVPTRHGFLTNSTSRLDGMGQTEPYQFDGSLRGNKTLRFYRNLDLISCMWEFVNYYDMSELVSDCGGAISNDGQVRNLVQSYVSITVPLYVSYIFHSPRAVGGWQHIDLDTKLRLTFVYDTAILWQNGIGAEEESELTGYLYPTSMRIRPDGRLVVDFRTEARFRGQFILTHPGSRLTSHVMSADQPDLSFSLELLRSESTFAQPEQQWQFVSDYAVRDYSGTYKVKLVPCTTSMNQEYTLPVQCNPRDPVTFDLEIRFQQVSDPVPAEFSLNTQFHLLRKRALWLSDGSMGFGDGNDIAFSPSDVLYGRIMVDPVQNLGDSFDLGVEKVFLCTGKDGYIPKYDPSNKEFGCVDEQSPNLLHSFKILDKGAPNTVATEFRDIPFDAKLALDDPSAEDLIQQRGSDGFRVACQPLFQVDSGRQWFLHAIYNVRSESGGTNRKRRSIETRHSIIQQTVDLLQNKIPFQHDKLHALESAAAPERRRMRREVRDSDNIGERGKGTNMVRISMNYSRPADSGKSKGSRYEIGENMAADSAESNVPILPVIAGMIALLIIVLIIAIIVVCRRRKRIPPTAQSRTVTMAGGDGRTKVVLSKSRNTYGDSTEI